MISAHGVHAPGVEPEAARVVDVAHLVRERAVAVQEDRGLLAHAASSSSAVAATRSTATRVMQRWSIGHSRSLHGAHAVSSRTTRGALRDRRRLGPVGRAEHRDERRAERGGEVHRARVVGEQQPQLAQHADELGERRLAAQHARGTAELRRDRLGERPLGGRADDRDLRAAAARHERRRGGEALGRPALGGAVGGAGVDADPGPGRAEQRAPALRPRFRAGERGVGRPRHREPQALEHRPIVVHLASAPEARAHAARARQERAARVGRIAPALRDARPPERERARERVRQQQPDVVARRGSPRRRRACRGSRRPRRSRARRRRAPRPTAVPAPRAATPGTRGAGRGAPAARARRRRPSSGRGPAGGRRRSRALRRRHGLAGGFGLHRCNRLRLPSSVQPQPLLGRLAHPALDDRGQVLRECRDVLVLAARARPVDRRPVRPCGSARSLCSRQRTGTIAQPVLSASAAATVVVHAGRPKKRTKMPSFACTFWSIRIATIPPLAERLDHLRERLLLVDDGVPGRGAERDETPVERRVVERAGDHGDVADLRHGSRGLDLPVAEVAGGRDDAALRRRARSGGARRRRGRRAPGAPRPAGPPSRTGRGSPPRSARRRRAPWPARACSSQSGKAWRRLSAATRRWRASSAPQTRPRPRPSASTSRRGSRRTIAPTADARPASSAWRRSRFTRPSAPRPAAARAAAPRRRCAPRRAAPRRAARATAALPGGRRPWPW